MTRLRPLLYPPLLSATLLAVFGCTVDEVPAGLAYTPDGDGPRVRYDLPTAPQGGVPLPNDTLTFPDPTSRTGLRLNLNLDASTTLERRIRERLNTLEGWGTFAPITVSFERPPPAPQTAQPEDSDAVALDLANLRERHQDDDLEFEDDAIYLIDLETGVPVPLDLGDGSFSYTLADGARCGPNDPRAGEPSLLWETADETVDPATGQPDASRTAYAPEFDVDCDGVLDRPNFADRSACPNQAQVGLGAYGAVERDRCIADNLLTWYERETDTVIARPLLPLRGSTRYAVVLTDRLVDASGNPVRSPFATVYHPSQAPAVRQLRDHLRRADLAGYFGDLAGTGLDHVAMTWTFTTAPVGDDLAQLRNGLYGNGAFGWLHREFPARLDAARSVVDDDSLADCAAASEHPYVVRMEDLRPTLAAMTPAELGLASAEQQRALIEALGALDHLVLGSYASPFFVHGGPDSRSSRAAFAINVREGTAEPRADRVPVWIAVPRSTDRWQQPFRTNVYVHRFGGSMVEVLGVAGELARSGMATVAMTAPWHGPDAVANARIETLFASPCHAPAAAAAARSRARDVDGDGSIADDSGSAFFSLDPFHTRDAIRQSVVDGLQLLRVLKSFDGRLSSQDFDADGTADVAGDFDANGTPDLGGPGASYAVWGQSLGGLVAVPVGALDPDVVATAPLGGAGAISDLANRATAPGLSESLLLPALGPVIVGVPASELDPDDTRCTAGEVSLRFVTTADLAQTEQEFYCLNLTEASLGAGLPRGGTVLAFNGANAQRRCARVASNGRFRISIPVDAGTRLELQIYDLPDAVNSYDPARGCRVTDEAVRIALIGETHFPPGQPLTAPTSGLGLMRQSPALRRLLTLYAHALDEADGVSFAPYYGLREMRTPDGGVAPATGALVIAPVGDQQFPIDGQIAVARAMGAVPFLRPDAAQRYPYHADYVTPRSLYEQLGDQTPHRVLTARQVTEGLARLQRHPPSDGCGVNETVPRAPNACHAECTNDADCTTDQFCDPDAGACRALGPDAVACAEHLFDVDVLDEGLGGYGQHTASVPLRLARVAAPADVAALEDHWEPRLAGTPYRPDQGAWRADKRTSALVLAYLDPHGAAALGPVDPCESFSAARYLRHLIGRFFETQGADPYYLSHPSTHRCLATGSCPVLSPTD